MVVTEIWAWVSEDTNGEEGIVAFPAPGGIIMAAVAAKRSSVERMRTQAEIAAVLRRKPVRLMHFTQCEEVEVISP